MAVTKKDAKKWLDDKHLDKNTIEEIFWKDSSIPITPAPTNEVLTGELIIEGYARLKRLELKDVRELDKLVIKDCPELEKVEISNSGVKELELGSGLDKLTLLDFGFVINADRLTARKVDEIDLSNVPNLKVIVCSGEQQTKLKGVENLKQLQTLDSGRKLDDTTVVLFPTEIFREWKKGLKEVLGITTDDLPDTWKTDLTTALGGANFTQLPTGKTLKNLIDDYSTDNDDLKNQLNQAKSELNNKKDYDTIKTERDQLNQQLEKIRKELGLGQNATEQQFIDKIKELMGRPTGPICTHTDYDTIKSERDSLKSDLAAKERRISELENSDKENNNKDKKSAITKKELTDSTNTNLSKWGFVISDEHKEKMQKAASAQEFEEARNEIIKVEVDRLKSENKSSFYFNLGLGALTIGSLLLLIWIMMRQANLPKIETKKDKNI